MRRNSGFTMLEMMIVVEILGIIFALALPNYIRARLQSNETAAVSNLRAILDAQITYNTVNHMYADSFDALTKSNPPFLSGVWDQERAGYQYRVESLAGNFGAYATPVDFGRTGWHGFYIDSSGVIRYAPNAEANAESPVLGKVL